MKPKNKKNEANKPEETKNRAIGYDLDAIEQMVNSRIESEICQLDGMEPMVETLSEFGIHGIRALSFIMRWVQLTAEYNAAKEEESE